MDGWDDQLYLNWTNFTIQGPVIAALTAEESAELVRCPREAPAVTRWWRSCCSRQRWPLSFMLCLICTSSIPSFFIQFTALLLSHQRYRSSRGVIECGDGNLVGRCVCLGDQGRTLGRWDQVVLVFLSLLLTLIYVFCKYFKGLSYQGCGQCLHVLRKRNCKSSLLWRGWGDRSWLRTCPIINNSKRPVDALAENGKLPTDWQLQIKRC